MPSGRPRTPSRGRPPKKGGGGGGGRSQSASRKAKSPPKKQKQQPQKKSKSPQKSTPKPRSSSHSRKVATAPAAVASKRREKSTSRPGSPRSSATRGTPRPMTSVTISTTTSAVRGSASPPMLRSRALGALLAQQTGGAQSSQKSPVAIKRGTQKSWGQTLRNNVVTRQLGKLGASIGKGPKPLLKSTGKHLRANWKYWLLAFAFLILAGCIYKFQKELLTHVQQINKQMVEFVQQQYDQQRRIFG